MANLIGQSLGRYHILEQLGEGGMATVYKAYDTRLERDVAVKVIRVDQFAPAVLERILKRFEREAKSLARLTHPNIVHVNDYGEEEGVPYLVMDYLPGGTLKQQLGKPMPWQEAVKLLLPVAEALDYAHSQGIIHRDVKPSNILLTQRGQPMLTDFGIAKLLESEETQTLTGTGAGVGTPEYMAPEQVNARSVDQRADIYSLGVVLYELITGRKPFQADTPMAVMIMQARDPLPRPAQFVRDLPEGVEKMLIKALAKKPEDRYVDMAAFAGALEGLLVGQSLASRPVTKPVAARPRMEDSMATIEQGESQETRLPEATRDEMVRPPAPVKKTKDQSPKPALPERLAASDAKSSSSSPGLNWKLWIPIVILVAILGIGLALGVGLLKMGQQGQGPLRGLATDTPTQTPTATTTQTTTPTRTHAPNNTFMPTYTPSSMPVVFTANENPYCRVGPDTIYPKVTIITAGTPVPVVGKSAPGLEEWWQVNSEEGICWVLGNMGTLSGDASRVAVAEAPPHRHLFIANGTVYYICGIEASDYVNFEVFISPYQTVIIDVTSAPVVSEVGFYLCDMNKTGLKWLYLPGWSYTTTGIYVK